MGSVLVIPPPVVVVTLSEPKVGVSPVGSVLVIPPPVVVVVTLSEPKVGVSPVGVADPSPKSTPSLPVSSS